MDHLAAIRRESDRFYAAAEGADPALAVPSCPGWSIADLVWHLGEVHWFWATDVELRATDPDVVEADKPERPAGFPELLAFGRAQAERLATVLEATDDATPVWTWSPPHQTVGFIRRHQVQEAAVHRWDLQLAAGGDAPEPIGATDAADAIDEVLEVTLPWGVDAEKPLPGSVHVHCTDTDGEWLIRADGAVERVHAKGDVALRGTSSDLLLVAFGRLGLEAIEVLGDAAVAEELLRRIGTD